MKLIFDRSFLEDFEFWVSTDRKTSIRILKLLKEISRDPFAGIGDPERLRHAGGKLWSRRLNEKDRLVYQVHDDEVRLLQCRGHYGDH